MASRLGYEDKVEAALWRRENRPQGEATCPKCGAPMHYRESTMMWRCTGCGDAETTAALYDAGAIVSMP